MVRYVIIGSGVAGISAIEAIRSRDYSGDITLISDDPFGYYSRPGLAYYLTGELGEQHLYPLPQQRLPELRVRILQARVAHIQPGPHCLELDNGIRLPYDRLMIATGASAARADTPGADLAGVVKLDNLEDARYIIKLARKSRSAVVVGGGITALELVEGLRARKIRTHYFLRGERYWSNVLDETESRIVEHRLKEEGVQIYYHTELGEILGRNGRVAAVRTKAGRLVSCDMVAIAIGIRPRTALAKEAGLQVERGIIVTEHMQSSEADIYAAGDVAQVYDPLTGKHVLDSLWGPAREQGYVAGQNMAGQASTYLKPIAFNVTRLANLTTTIIGTVGRGDDEDLFGIARGDSEVWRQLPDAIAAQADFEVNRLRLVMANNTIIGAIIMGDQTLSRPLQQLVAKKVDISTVRERWLKPDAPLAELVTDFYLQWRQSDAARQP